MTDRDEPFDEPLDDLLQQAVWPDMRLAEKRLRQQMIVRQSRSWRGRIAVAATISLVCGVTFVIYRGSRNPSVQQAIIVPTVMKPVELSRPSTAYESLLIAPAKRPGTVKPGVHTPREIVEALLIDLSSGKSQKEVAVALQKLPTRDYVWRTLQQRITQEPANATNIAITLGVYAQQGEAQRLLPLLYNRQTRACVLDSYVRLASVSDLLKARALMGDSLLVTALLQRDDEGVQALLRLSADPYMIHALADVENPPVQALVRAVESSDAQVRSAAMKILSALPSQDAAAALASLVERDVRRQEALLALVASHSSSSKAFVEQFRRVPGLAAQITVFQKELQVIE